MPAGMQGSWEEYGPGGQTSCAVCPAMPSCVHLTSDKSLGLQLNHVKLNKMTSRVPLSTKIL